MWMASVLQVVVLLNALPSRAQTIDSFRRPMAHKTNDLGSWRHSSHVITLIDPPIAIMATSIAYLAEGLSATNECTDLTGKALCIQYSAVFDTMAKLKFIEFEPDGRTMKPSTSKGIEVSFYASETAVVVPISDFVSIDPTMVSGFNMTGPISHQVSLKCVELIDLPVQYISKHAVAPGLLLDEFSHMSVLKNSLGLRMSFNYMTLSIFGLLLPHVDSYLKEELAPLDKCMDITGKSLRIKYSSDLDATIKIRLSCARNACSTNSDIILNYALIIFPVGINKELIIPFTAFKLPVPTVCFQMKMRGPLYLHRIEIIDSSSAHPPVSIATVFQFITFYMRNAIEAMNHSGPATITVDRSLLYDSTFLQIISTPARFLQSKLIVKFYGETGVDEGGLSRELFTLLSRELSDPDRNLFVMSADSKYALHINPNFKDLVHFKFVGRVLGMAILHDRLLNVRFETRMFKLIQGYKPTLQDLKEIDPDMYQSLKKTLAMENAHLIGMTMSVDYQGPHGWVTENLVPDGENIPVTDSNKLEYVDMYCQWRIGTRYKAQIEAIREGMLEIIPRRHLARFRAYELVSLVSGTERIDPDVWRQYTAYLGGYADSDPAIDMFWNCVSEWTQQERADLLIFVTGSPRLPPKEFRTMYGALFIINRALDATGLPTARTCAKLLNLPPYPDPSTMCARLMYAVQETGGFDIV